MINAVSTYHFYRRGSSDVPALAKDQIVGKYNLKRKLGRGGMGEVWEIWIRA